MLDILFDCCTKEEEEEEEEVVTLGQKRKRRHHITPFRELSDTYKLQLKRKITNSVFELFDKHIITHPDDMRDIMKLVEQDVGVENTTSLAIEEAVEKQRKHLTLHQRNDLCRLLTHNADGKPDIDILGVFPMLKERSHQLAATDAAGGRKERCDKIDLQFIEDYMHDYCR